MGIGMGRSLEQRPESAERVPCAKLVEQRPRGHAGDGAELGDEVRLVVVAGRDSDGRPARRAFSARGAYGTTKTRELGEGLRTHADRLTEQPTEVSLAHAEVDSDGVHLGVREAIGRSDDHGRAVVPTALPRRALDDGALQDLGRCQRVASGGQTITETTGRGVAPEILEWNDASSECSCRDAEDRLDRTEVKAGHHDALPPAQHLSTDGLERADRVYV